MSAFLKNLCLTTVLLALTQLAPLLPAATAPDNLVWWPYLQQMTDTSLIILWTTRTGATPVVRYATDTGYGQLATGTTRPTPLNTHMHRIELNGLQPNTHWPRRIRKKMTSTRP